MSGISCGVHTTASRGQRLVKFQELHTHTENMRNTDLLLQSAREVFDAVQRRYQSGLGNMLENPHAQGTLCATARLQLAALPDL